MVSYAHYALNIFPTSKSGAAFFSGAYTVAAASPEKHLFQVIRFERGGHFAAVIFFVKGRHHAMRFAHFLVNRAQIVQSLIVHRQRNLLSEHLVDDFAGRAV